MDEMFKYSLKPENSFFKSNEDFYTKFGESRQQARIFQARQARYLAQINAVKK